MTDNNEYYDEQASRKQEEIARTPDMQRQREALLELLDLELGESVLDVGSGNGILARELVQKVGDSGRVVVVDPADAMIDMSRRICPEAEFVLGGASELPFEEEQFDVATASQVLCFVENVPAALAEFYRVLKPGGRLVILDSDWGSLIWHNNASNLLDAVIAELTLPYTCAYVPRTLSRELSKVGFKEIGVHSHPLVNTRLDQDSYSAQMMTFLPINDSGDALGDRWSNEMRTMADNGEYFFSLNRYIFSATKS